MKNYFIATPIYYVNDKPHIGHAYTNIVADVIARFKRLDNINVKFSTGTDEHGQKVAKSAAKNHLTPQEFSNVLSAKFRELADNLNLNQYSFIRTTLPFHQVLVKILWEKLEAKDQIYLGKYTGWYSVRDEAFYTEEELIDGKAPTGARVEWLEEESYFFRLSHWQKKLLEYYAKHPNFIKPMSRYNEIVSFVKSGLNDISISRVTNSWGIQVPKSPKHTIYVWFEALINYLSVLSDDKEKFWPPNLHIIGKDILRFHAVFWPAILMALDYDLPECVLSHGWWMNNGEKISKSLGNVIDPNELIEKYSADYLRYFLLKEVTLGQDGNFSEDKLIKRLNSEVVNKIGNLIYRTSSFIYKKCYERIPIPNQIKDQDKKIFAQAYNMPNIIRNFLTKYDLKRILEEIINLASKANIYIDEEAPWKLEKIDPKRMYTVLYVLMEVTRVIAISLQAFMPEHASKILDYLHVKDRGLSAINSELSIKSNTRIKAPEIFFKKVETFNGNNNARMLAQDR